MWVFLFHSLEILKLLSYICSALRTDNYRAIRSTYLIFSWKSLKREKFRHTPLWLHGMKLPGIPTLKNFLVVLCFSFLVFVFYVFQWQNNLAKENFPLCRIEKDWIKLCCTNKLYVIRAKLVESKPI